MKLRTTLARVVAVALVATSGAVASTAVTAPAHAAGTHATTITLDPISTSYLNDFGAVEYGDDFALTGKVAATDGTSLYCPSGTGTATLEALPYGATAWTPVATDTSASSLSFYGVVPSISTQYRVSFAGCTTTSSNPDTFQPAVSAPVTVGVARVADIKIKGRNTLVGKVKPDFAKQKLIFQKKKGKRFVKWFKVRTNAKGKFRKTVSGKVGDEFAVVWPASNGYAGGVSVYCFTSIGFCA